MATVEFSKASYAKIFIHASTNPNTSLYGILLGRRASSSVTVSDVIPISHSTPTKPLLDMALRITDAFCQDQGSGLKIVGWYTANEREGDDTPSPIARKIVENMNDGDDSSSESQSSPMLVFINSSSLEVMLKGECEADGRGKGLDVYMSNNEKVSDENVKVEGGDWVEVAGKVANVCLKDDLEIFDFENQLESGRDGLKKNDWLRNPQVSKLI